MENICGKRLLILGGTTLMIHVVKVAREMGVYTVVTDISPKAPAKQYADAAYDVSTGEMDALVELARKERIDGIFTGYEDFNTSVAVELSQRLGIPFYATKEQIDITKNKIAFKNLCRQYDVPVVKEYKEKIEFPCVVKPADSYSAKGITICREPESLEEAIVFARQFSRTDSYLIEKYMDCDSVDCVNVDYLLRDGEIKLSAVGDKKVIRQGNKAPLTAAVYYPSKHMEEYIRDVDEKVVNMFKHLGMKNGTVFIEIFYDKDGFSVYEMGYRVGGGQSSILLNNLCGFDYVKMLISYALTQKMCDEEVFNSVDPHIEKSACGLVLLMSEGKVAEIAGIEEVKKLPGVINITQYIHEGDEVKQAAVGTLGQTFARIHIIADNEAAMLSVIEQIQDSIKVFDVNHNNLIVKNQIVL